jgi:hypothetical protein
VLPTLRLGGGRPVAVGGRGGADQWVGEAALASSHGGAVRPESSRYPHSLKAPGFSTLAPVNVNE